MLCYDPTDYLQFNHVFSIVSGLMDLLNPRSPSLYLRSSTLYVVQNFVTLSLFASNFVPNLTAVPYDLRPLRLVEIHIIHPTSDSTQSSMYNIFWLPVGKKSLSSSRAQRYHTSIVQHATASIYRLWIPAVTQWRLIWITQSPANYFLFETCSYAFPLRLI